MKFLKLTQCLYTSLTSTDFIEHAYETEFSERTVSSSACNAWILHIELMSSPLKFFLNCCTDLRHLITSFKNEDTVSANVSWNSLKDDVNIRYINALIYYFLLKPNNVQRVESVALNAASYYFLLLSLPDSTQNSACERKVFSLAMNALANGRKTLETSEIVSCVNDFYILIQRNDEAIAAKPSQVFKLLTGCTRYKSWDDIDQFVYPAKNVSHIAFCGLQLYVCKQYARQCVPEMLCHLTKNYIAAKDELTYQSDYSLNYLHGNTSNFLNALPTVLGDSFYDELTTFAKLLCMKNPKDKKGLDVFYARLPMQSYRPFRKWFIKCVQKQRVAKASLIDCIPVLLHKHVEINEEKAVVFNSILLKHLIEICCHPHVTVRYKAFRNLADVLCSKDPHKVAAVKAYFADENLTREMIFYAVSKTINCKSSTKHIKYILTVLIQLMDINPDWFTNKTISWIQILCSNAPSNELRGIIPILRDILYKYHHLQVVVRLFFNVCIPNVIFPAPYTKVTSTIVANVIFDASNTERLTNVVEVLLTKDYEIDELFRKLSEFDLINNYALRTIMDLNLNPILWKLVAASIRYVKATSVYNLPEMITVLITEGEHPHVQLVIFCLYEVIKKDPKLAKHTYYKGGIQSLQLKLRNGIKNNSLPQDAVPTVVRFLQFLNDVYNEPTTWASVLLREKENALFRKLNNILELNISELESQTELKKELLCLTELMAVTRLHLRPYNMEVLDSFVQNPFVHPTLMMYFVNHTDVWSDVMILYTRICMRLPSKINSCVRTFQRFLEAPFEELQLLSLDIIYDICSQNLQHFEPIVPFLFHFIFSSVELLRFKSIKIIIELVEKDHLKLVDIKYFQFIALLVDPSFGIRQEMKKAMEEVFFKKYENYVAAQFVQTVVYLNCYELHPTLKINSVEVEILQNLELQFSDRYNIYYYLFSHISDELQLSVLQNVAKEIITPAIQGTLNTDSRGADVLSDVLVLAALVNQEDEELKYGDNPKEYYAKFLKSLLNSFTRGHKQFSKAQKRILDQVKNVVNSLLNLLFKMNTTSDASMEEVFHAVIIITKKYRKEIIDIITDDDKNLHKLYKQLNQLYIENIDTFQYASIDLQEQLNNEFITQDDEEFEYKDRSLTGGGTRNEINPF